jgi:hypothetical protein
MLYTDFCQEFDNSIEKGNISEAHYTLMRELGNILVREKQDFVDLLNESGVEAMIIDSNTELVDKFVENLPHNRNLMIGASLLAQMHNRKMGFDGSDTIDDRMVKNGYGVMQSYFSGNYQDETQSNAVGAIVAGALGAASAGAGLTKTALERKREKEGVGRNLATQKEASKQAIVQGILAQQQQKADAMKQEQQDKAKTRKLLYIIGGSILAIAVIGVVAYTIKKGKK